MREVITVTKDNKKDYPDAAKVLQHAFSNDPVHKWFFQRDFTFYDTMLFDILIDQVAIDKNKGIVYAVMDDGKMCSSCLWFEGYGPEWYEYLGFASLLFRYPYAAYRLQYCMNRLESRHHVNMKDKNHLYLCAIGTEPDLAGKGYGSQLLQYGLDKADREGKPAYLESSKPENVPFYEKFGFVLIEEIQDGDMPPLFAMKREPKVANDVSSE